MKSKINTSTNKDYTFPCLMKYNNAEHNINDFIVLFTSRTNGTVVHVYEPDNENIKDPRKLGEYSTIWSIEFFQPFDGEITLF